MSAVALPSPEETIRFGGFFEYESWDKPLKSGRRRLMHKGRSKNLVPLAHLSHILATQYVAGTQVTTWFCGLINNSPSPTLSTANTAASHAAWTELTNYSESVRQTWGTAESGQAVSNASLMTFSINATVAIYGAFIISNSTKGGSTGNLGPESAFDSVQNLVNGQSLRISYTMTAAGA
jgi:hypothetical protein